MVAQTMMVAVKVRKVYVCVWLSLSLLKILLLKIKLSIFSNMVRKSICGF